MRINKLILGGWVLSLGLAGFLGYRARQPEVVTKVERVVEQGKTEVKVVEVIKERVVSKDGVITEREITRESNTNEERVASKDLAKPVVLPTNSKPKYSLQVNYLPSLSAVPTARDVQIEVGARLGNTPLFVVTGYDVKHNQISVGIKYEF